jgi:hypothetical protein
LEAPVGLALVEPLGLLGAERRDHLSSV